MCYIIHFSSIFNKVLIMMFWKILSLSKKVIKFYPFHLWRNAALTMKHIDWRPENILRYALIMCLPTQMADWKYTIFY